MGGGALVSWLMVAVYPPPEAALADLAALPPSASWSLGGDSGSLSGLTTTAQLPLRTEEIQAVITPAGQPPPTFDLGPPPSACPSTPLP